MTQAKLPDRILVGLAFPEDPTRKDYGVAEYDAQLLREAQTLALQCQAAVELVHVIEAPEVFVPGSFRYLHALLTDAVTPQLEALCEKMRAVGIAASHHIAYGRAFRELILRGRAIGADLIMVAPRGRKAPLLDRLVYGSTTQRLLRKCELPLWVAAAEAGASDEGAEGWRQILVPTDFSPVSETSMRLAESLAARAGSGLHLLHCASHPAMASMHLIPDAVLAADELRAQSYAEAQRQLKLQSGNSDWQSSLAVGVVAQEVCRYAEAQAVDLVVMGTLASGGLSGLLLGSTAGAILERLRCSAWLHKPADWVSPVTAET